MMIENNEYYVEFGKFIKEARIRKEMSQKTIAEQLEWSQSYYSMVEHGKRPPDLAMAHKICNILEISLQDFELAMSSKTDKLIEKTAEKKSDTSYGEMLTGKIEKKSEGKSVSIYLTTEALENLERFAKANGCSKSRAADYIFRKLY